MNTMKKYFALLLCVSMVLGLAACGASQTKPTTNNAETKPANITETKPANNKKDEPISGGWSTGEPAELTDEQIALFEKATEGYTGVSYTPVLYLATQVVGGYNHRILCKAQVVYPDAPETWAIVEIYEDPEGNAEITNVTDLTDEEAAQYGVETEPLTQIPNPFIDCDTLDDAAKIAEFPVTLPSIDGYPGRWIQAIKNEMIQVCDYSGEYAEEGSESVLFRKGVGAEDISGDYNVYDAETEHDVNGKTVTLKGDGKLVYLAIWTDGGYSYSISASAGMDANAMLALVNGLK